MKYYCPKCGEYYNWPVPVKLGGQMVCEGCAALANEKEIASIIARLSDERQARKSRRKSRLNKR